MNKSVKVLICFFLVSVLFGCGGGGGESKNSQPASTPSDSPVKVMDCMQRAYIQADFNQEISEPGCSNENNVSVFVRKYADGSGIYIDIWTKAVNPIYGQGFYLAFDPSMLQYDGFESGQFFGTDSQATVEIMGSGEGAAGGTFYGCNQMPGKSVAVAGILRLGAYAAELSGNSLAFRMKFRIVGSGEADLVFAKTVLLRRVYGDPVKPIKELTDACWPKSIKIKI